MIKKIRENLILRLLLVFLIYTSLFLFVHLLKTGLWSSDDPYYHAKHSELIAQTGNLTLVRPWLEFHFFNYAPVDPWWGFHLLSAFFIHFFGTILGVKICASALAGLAFTVFYFIICRFNASRPFLWTFLFFSSSSFLEYRLAIERPFLLAVVLLPIAAYLIYIKRHWSLFFLSALFMLLYNLAPLVILLAVLFISAEYYQNKKINLKPLIATSAGILVGILLHPDTLNYFYILFVHFWQILYLKYRGIDLGIGNEVQTEGFFDFIIHNQIAIFAFILACSLLVAFKSLRKKLAVIYFFLISFFWFLVTLLVPRGGDFWLPFAWLFIVLLMEEFARSADFVLIKEFIKRNVNLKLAGVFVFFGFFLFIFNNYFQIYNYVFDANQAKDQDYYYQAANDWLKKHTAPASMIFYNSWSLWPRMFFYNDYNRYVLGVDPTFLYEYDPNIYWLWSNISKKGEYCPEANDCPRLSPAQKHSLVSAAIKNTFKSDYLLIEKDPSEILPLIKVANSRKQDFRKVYENQVLVIYKIVQAPFKK